MQSFSTLFLATATALLLAGTSACSKKEDPTPAPIKTGTYTLDNQILQGTATYRTLKSYYAAALLGDVALVSIYDGATSETSPRSTTLTFFKTASSDSDYKLVGVETITSRAGNITSRRTYPDNLRFTLTQTTPHFSGTFSASSTSATASPATSTLASGQLTAVPE